MNHRAAAQEKHAPYERPPTPVPAWSPSHRAVAAADPVQNGGAHGAMRTETVQHGRGQRGDETPEEDAGEDPDHGDPKPAGEGGRVRRERADRHQGGRHREEAAAG